MPAMHLANLNVAAAKAPLDDPVMVEFMDALAVVNAAAEGSPGFVWRLQDDSGSATSIQAFADPRLLVNLTVFESVETLKEFTYRGIHGDFFRRRREWFEPDDRGLVLWWVPAGHRPTVSEAIGRLAFRTRHGTSPYAFTFASADHSLLVEPSPLDSPTSQRLIADLNAELDATYPEPGSNFTSLDAAEVEPGTGQFLVAELDGVPVGCGAFRRLDPGVVGGAVAVEIKRMYVRTEARGHKVGAAVLARLEFEAAAQGATVARLETGPQSHAALTTYERAGYQVIPCWGEYAGAPASVCLEKRLTLPGL